MSNVLTAVVACQSVYLCLLLTTCACIFSWWTLLLPYIQPSLRMCSLKIAFRRFVHNTLHSCLVSLFVSSNSLWDWCTSMPASMYCSDPYRYLQIFGSDITYICKAENISVRCWSDPVIICIYCLALINTQFDLLFINVKY